ncbi:MAG: flagellar hook-length control protein FliK [Acidobacteria bacterium]|nr:flagellar hook-length control protein FliK [Acidobacteriota bacterium]
MQRIDQTSSTPASAPAEAPDRGERKDGGAAEFDKVMDRKTTDRPKSEQTSEPKGTQSQEKLDTARGTEHGVTRQQEREGQSGGGGGGEGGGFGQQSRDESQQYRPIPGDMAMPFDLYMRMPQIDAKPVAALHSAEAIAQIQQIADRIVDAVQVRMQPGGMTDVHLELNMGRLGNMTVELHRAADGQLRVDFQAATSDCSEMLRSNISDLTGRLQDRGIALAQVSVRSADRAEFRWEPPVTKSDQAVPLEQVTQAQPSADARWTRGGPEAPVRGIESFVNVPLSQTTASQADARPQASSESQQSRQQAGDQERQREKKEQNEGEGEE